MGVSLLMWAPAVGLMTGGASGHQQDSCEIGDEVRWVVEMIDETRRDDLLFRFAQGAFGVPVACEGRVTGEFDGQPFGEVRFHFRDEVTLEIETMPPLVRIVTLTHPTGFPGTDAVLEAARTYAEVSGFVLDWGAPASVAEGEFRRDEYRDPEPGLNASVTLVWSADRLRSVRIASAP
jgi:hypothetical protein